MPKSFTAPYIVDVEASGFGPDSYPIEIGVVKSDKQRYCTLVQPHEDWQHWSEDAEELHGISRETLASSGKPIDAVCEELNEFLKDEYVFSDAWSHDQGWLDKLYRIADIRPSFSVRAIEFILNEAQLRVWDLTKQRICAEHQAQRHRASYDAHLIQLTYIESLSKTRQRSAHS